MTNIESEIRTYAFNQGTDLDKATYKVLNDKLSETSRNQSYQGLYDKLFSPAGTIVKEGR